MKKLITILGVALAGIVLAGVDSARAIQFSPQLYTSMAEANSAETIPVGTKITLQNWRNYKRFMPVWLQAAFSQEYTWRIDKGPGYVIEVKPTRSYPLPHKYVEDTEKYGGQAKLVKAPTGGLTWTGYVAGVPFPNPSEPDRAYKILYNDWGSFRPLMFHFNSFGWLVDRFGNVTTDETDDSFYRLSHISEPGVPVNYPGTNGIYYASRFIVREPEQSKYTTELTLQPDDPTRLQEIYVFVPSLRRSLRLSSAAKCAPILGTDFVEDENSYLPPDFTVELLGEKKLLTVSMVDTEKAYQRSSYAAPPTGFPGWPKPDASYWEVRPYYILHLQWIPKLGGYCFSHRIFYVDKESYVQFYAEGYDNEQKLWKLVWALYPPIEFKGQKTIITGTTSSAIGVDFQNTHITASVIDPPEVDDQMPAQYKDIAAATSPGDLARILK